MISRGISRREVEAETAPSVKHNFSGALPLNLPSPSPHRIVGSAPIATTIRASMLYILSNPRVHQALHAELRAYNLLSPSSTSDIRLYCTMRSLPYLNALIQEFVRFYLLYMPLLEITVPSGGDTFLDCSFVHTGTMIGCFM